MKLATYLLPLSSLLIAANAADCTAPNAQFWSNSAVQMMWSMREYACVNHWSENIVIVPDGGWCDAGGGFVSAYWGEWHLAGLQSQTQCWDTTEEIINQCMGYDTINAYNGGSWNYGDIHVSGWFWGDNGKSCIHPVSKRGLDRDIEIETDNEGPIFTFEDGTVSHVDRKVWVDISADGKATLVRDEVY
ncbi:hypothetical protein BJX99DRAFT_251768 [Aspergillus californicus]